MSKKVINVLRLTPKELDYLHRLLAHHVIGTGPLRNAHQKLYEKVFQMCGAEDCEPLPVAHGTTVGSELPALRLLY